MSCDLVLSDDSSIINIYFQCWFAESNNKILLSELIVFISHSRSHPSLGGCIK